MRIVPAKMKDALVEGGANATAGIAGAVVAAELVFIAQFASGNEEARAWVSRHVWSWLALLIACFVFLGTSLLSSWLRRLRALVLP